MFRTFVVAVAVGGLFTAACATTPAGDGAVESPGVVSTAEGLAVEVLDDKAEEAAGPEEATGAEEAAEPGEVVSAVAYTIVAQAAVPEVVVRAGPDDASESVAALTNPLPSGAPLVFRAVDGGAESSEWIEVHLPIQPNGSTGWVRRGEMTLSNNPYRIEIDRASYSLRVFNLDEVWIETSIAVGNGATPTPVGDFYLLELLAPPNPDGDYGPFAFGLSGFSEVLDGFGGSDDAIIGLHGTNDPASIGTDVSHGCIRLENSVIEELAATVPLGTPVRIV